MVTTLVCFTYIRTRGYGCIGHPAFPTPSVFLGERFLQNLGRIAPRECGAIFEIGCSKIESELGYKIHVVPAKPTGPASGRPDDRLHASRDPYVDGPRATRVFSTV